jgi:hypothetical protein
MQIKDLLKDFSVDNSLQDQVELLIKLETDINYILKTQEEPVAAKKQSDLGSKQ